MAGARIPVTRPMRVIPPMITRATTVAVHSPLIHAGIPKVVSRVSATVLAWMALPVTEVKTNGISSAVSTAAGAVIVGASLDASGVTWKPTIASRRIWGTGGTRQSP